MKVKCKHIPTQSDTQCMEYFKKQWKKSALRDLENEKRLQLVIQEVARATAENSRRRKEAREKSKAKKRTFDCPGCPLRLRGTSEGQAVPVKTRVMVPGQLFRDEKGEQIILVDGVISSLLYAFDRYADKAVINATLAREFGFEALKNSRILLYQAYSLQDDNGRIPEKRTEETLLKDLWEKVTKIDMKGSGKVVVCMPYNFTIPRFVSDAEILAETTRDTTSSMLMERMNALEKKMEQKNKGFMDILNSINTKIQASPPPPQPPSFSYASVVGAGQRSNGLLQGRNQAPSTTGGPGLTSGASTDRSEPFRERTASFKRPRIDNDFILVSKRRAAEKVTGKPVVTGNRAGETTRRMKSPPVDIFVYGVPRATEKADIVADLADSDIKIEESDIILMSKGSPSVLSYKISVKAEDLEKAMNPSVWPMRVKVREFIHYRSVRQVREKGNLPQPTQLTHMAETRNKGNPEPRDGNIYNVLSGDISASK